MARPKKTEWTVIVRHTFTEEDRRALAAYHGEKGMATLAGCRAWAHSCVGETLVDALSEYHNRKAPTE